MNFDYIVKVKKRHSEAKLPKQSHSNDAGYDVFSIENVIILPHSTVVVDTGININLWRFVYEDTEEFEKTALVCKVCCRSGMAAKNGVEVLNSPGIVDQNYTGPLKVILHNTTDNSVEIKVEDRIAQLLFEMVYLPKFEIVEEFEATDRGENGFGSTDRIK